jgi:hypothetical protein
LPTLRKMTLSGTRVRDARLFATLKAKGVELVLDGEQEALLEKVAPSPPVASEPAK